MDRQELIGFLISACIGDRGDDYAITRAVVNSGVLLGDPITGEIHGALLECLSHCIPVTHGTVASIAASCIQGGNLPEVAGLAHRIVEYVWDLQPDERHRSAWARYLSAVVDMDQKNKVLENLESCAEAIRSGKMAPSEVSVSGATEGSRVSSGVASGHFCGNLRERLDAFWDGGESQFVETQWPTLNKKMGGGWRRAALNFIVARPGGGKSAMAEQEAEFQSTQGRSVIYCAIEMDPEDHIARIVRRRHHARLLASGALDFESRRLLGPQREVVTECISEVEGLGIRFLSCTSSSVQSIIGALDREWSIRPFDVVVFDYFQLLTFDALRYASTLDNLKHVLSSALLPWVRLRNVAAVIPAQAKRDLDDPEAMPKKSDIADCSEAEKLASNVVFCHEGRFVVAKARRGVPGIIDVDWHGSSMSFKEKASDGFMI